MDRQTDVNQPLTETNAYTFIYLFQLYPILAVLLNYERTRRQAPPNSTAPHHDYNTTMPAVGWNTHFGDHNISVDMSRTVYNLALGLVLVSVSIASSPSYCRLVIVKTLFSAHCILALLVTHCVAAILP